MSKLLQRCVLLIAAIFVAFPLHPPERGFALPTQSGTPPPVAEADFSQMTQPGVLHEIVGDLGYEEYPPGNDYMRIIFQRVVAKGYVMCPGGYIVFDYLQVLAICVKSD